MKVGSLFSGIGGLELGLDLDVAWQVELDPYCRRVLARHWPDAERHEDVRAVGAHNLEPVDVICGGFPCQDISTAGAGAGLAGERSGLWFEMLRIINELRPRYVVAENVAALRTRGLDVVLAGLRDAGYRTSWSIVGASELGAPHQRKRLWLVASRADQPMVYAPTVTVSDQRECALEVWPLDGGDPELWERGEPRTTEIRTHRNARLRALGNAVVPQIPRMIGRALRGERGDFDWLPQQRAASYLPTPTASAYGSNQRPGPAGKRPSLDAMARTRSWPTPTVSGLYGKRREGTASGDGLATSVRQWPTPTAHNAKGAPGEDSIAAGGRQSDLVVAVRQWPTPTTQDAANNGGASQLRRNTIPLNAAVGPGQMLSPRWVELLMGYPLGWTEIGEQNSDDTFISGKPRRKR